MDDGWMMWRRVDRRLIDKWMDEGKWMDDGGEGWKDVWRDELLLELSSLLLLLLQKLNIELRRVRLGLISWFFLKLKSFAPMSKV